MQGPEIVFKGVWTSEYPRWIEMERELGMVGKNEYGLLKRSHFLPGEHEFRQLKISFIIEDTEYIRFVISVSPQGRHFWVDHDSLDVWFLSINHLVDYVRIQNEAFVRGELVLGDLKLEDIHPDTESIEGEYDSVIVRRGVGPLLSRDTVEKLMDSEGRFWCFKVEYGGDIIYFSKIAVWGLVRGVHRYYHPEGNMLQGSIYDFDRFRLELVSQGYSMKKRLEDALP